MDDFSPADDGSAPLARAADWVRVESPSTGQPARRDTDTMPGWAGSCWYWLRFMDPGNDAAAFAREAEAYWGPVDLYVGGAAHAVMHLLYARFWHKVFFDEGLVSTAEPFQRLFNQGLITAFAYQDASGRLVPSDEVEPRGDGFVRARDEAPLTQIVTKMAKSLRNVVNPDDVIDESGADTLRVYQMFMGPLADSKPWNPRDIAGSRRFLERAWRLFVDEDAADPVRPHLRVDQQALPEGPAAELERSLNRALQRVDDSFKGFNFNTAIAALMGFVNEATRRVGALTRGQGERFLLALSPFAPHVADELWTRLGNEGSICLEAWPQVDPAWLEEDSVEIVVQVLGKVRGRVRLPKGASQPEVERAAREAVPQWLEGKQLVRTVVVPGKLVNLIVK
jgi:leucyl-tRNA synthetase